MCGSITTFKSQVETGLNVKLTVDSRPDYHLTISAILFNNSAIPITGSCGIVFLLSYAGAVYTPQSGKVNAVNARNLQMDPIIINQYQYMFKFAGLGAGAYASYLFQVRYDSGTRKGVSVATTVTASGGGQWAVDQKAVILLPPLEKT